MKALVTGATGFVGGHLVDALLGRGDQVTALVRNPTKAARLERRGVVLVRGDLTDEAAMLAACRNQDIVYHLAGLIAARSELEFLEVNRDGVARLAAATAAIGGARFVLLSSLAAGGPSTDRRPLRGPEPPRPTTQYGRSKLAGERALEATALAWTIVRPPAVYGPNDREMLRVFRAATLGLAPVFGDGSQLLSLIFGPDLAQAIIAAGTTDRTVGGHYYAAHPEVLTSRQLIELVGQAAGRRVRTFGVPEPIGRAALWATELFATLLGRATVLSRDKANEFFQPAWICDPTPLTEATGWEAKHDLASGARATLEWYRAHGWL